MMSPMLSTAICSGLPVWPAQPSPMCDAINAGYGYLEVRCLGCDTHQTVALDIARRPKTTPVHELEHALPPVLRSPRLSLQAEPFDRAALNENFGERSAVALVAGRAAIASSVMGH